MYIYSVKFCKREKKIYLRAVTDILPILQKNAMSVYSQRFSKYRYC